MPILDLAQLRTSLVRHESIRLKPYVDTKGKLSIGVGRNLTDTGITRAEAMILLDNDIVVAIQSLDNAYPWWRSLDPPRQLVLAEMSFNLGITRLSGFKLYLSALQAGDFGEAADQMMKSDWATQVGHRASELADMMRFGAYPQQT